MAAFIAPLAAFIAVGADAGGADAGGDAHAVAAGVDAPPVAVAEAAPCCMEIVPLALATPASTQSDAQLVASSTSTRVLPASRWRVAQRQVQQVLPVGVAPEQGLQVRTILAERSISAVFPEIKSIGGVRPDALRWHPDGLALDVMIPNAGTAEGIALGNQIVAFALKNAHRFALQDAIWRGVYYTPSGPGGSGNGHFDHVHITTLGGGYPTGGEIYAR